MYEIHFCCALYNVHIIFRCAYAGEIPLFPSFSRPFYPQVMLQASFIVQRFRVSLYHANIMRINGMEGKGSVGIDRSADERSGNTFSRIFGCSNHA